MVYEVLARKWRPQKFSEVVGQEHITRTLLNAIMHDRVGHAYLFVGPRGTGKTTSARIFAKALNCENPLSNGEPCCQCQNCLEISSGISMDVQEIDGASHNKVEDMRELRDNICYAPTRSKYRIYIIDEVHMLSTSAWNALLKTLEEPPRHVKFLFATTEPHKVLATIISRCQRFDLKPISIPLIVQQLKKIIAPEKIFIEENALIAIARAAEGGMRDAQSILDQIIAFCDGHQEENPITEQDVIDVFGLASSQELQILVGSLIGNNQDQLFTIVQEIANKGRDLERLFEDLLNYFRNLIVCRLTKNARQILQIEEQEFLNLFALTELTTPAVLQRILQGLVENANGIRNALNKRVYLEANLSRIAYESHALQIEDLVAQINYLKQQESIPQVSMPLPQMPAQIIIQNIVHSTSQNGQQKICANEAEIISPKNNEDIQIKENDSKEEAEIELEKKNEEVNLNNYDQQISVIEQIGECSPSMETSKINSVMEAVQEEYFPQNESMFVSEEFTPSHDSEEIIEENDCAGQQMEEESIDLETNNIIEDENEEILHNQQAEKIWIQAKLNIKDRLSFDEKECCNLLIAMNLMNHLLTLGYDPKVSKENLNILLSANLFKMIDDAVKEVSEDKMIAIQIHPLAKSLDQRVLTSSKESFDEMKKNPVVQLAEKIFNAELIEVKE